MFLASNDSKIIGQALHHNDRLVRLNNRVPRSLLYCALCTLTSQCNHIISVASLGAPIGSKSNLFIDDVTTDGEDEEEGGREEEKAAKSPATSHHAGR